MTAHTRESHLVAIPGGSHHDLVVDVDASRAAVHLLDPRRLVQRVPMLLLIEACVGHRHPFAISTHLEPTSFMCPRCEHVDHNGGSAVIVDGYRWRCHRCRFDGTRLFLERIVLEDSTAMDRFYSILAAEEIR